MDIKNRFIEEGRVERGWLGITMQPLSRDIAGYMNMPEQGGAIVNGVMEDSPASEAGIKPGDIIASFGGQAIEAENEGDLKNFQRLIGQTEVDKNIKIEVIRNGKKMEFFVKIKKQPKIELKEIESEYGFNVMEITTEIYLANRLESKKGVFVSFVEPGSAAGEANLFPGDIIVWIEGKEINNIDDFRKAIESLKGKKRFLIKALRGRDLIFALFKTGK